MNPGPMTQDSSPTLAAPAAPGSVERRAYKAAWEDGSLGETARTKQHDDTLAGWAEAEVVRRAPLAFDPTGDEADRLRKAEGDRLATERDRLCTAIERGKLEVVGREQALADAGPDPGAPPTATVAWVAVVLATALLSCRALGDAVFAAWQTGPRLSGGLVVGAVLGWALGAARFGAVRARGRVGGVTGQGPGAGPSWRVDWVLCPAIALYQLASARSGGDVADALATGLGLACAVGWLHARARALIEQREDHGAAAARYAVASEHLNVANRTLARDRDALEATEAALARHIDEVARRSDGSRAVPDLKVAASAEARLGAALGRGANHGQVYGFDFVPPSAAQVRMRGRIRGAGQHRSWLREDT